MHAVILAAGKGSRLAESNPQGSPKCLLEFNGKSLLERHLHLLQGLGVYHADLVVGYEADQIVDHVGRLQSRPAVAFHFNPRYQQGSVISLWAAAETLESGEDVLLMDADVLYHPSILQRLVQTQHKNCLLLDRDFQVGDEPVKIVVRGGLIVDFRKRIDGSQRYDLVGESVGFFRFDAECAARIARECARFETEGLADAPHEEALRNVILENPRAFAVEDVTGLPWIEIDFPEDVLRAREEVLPALPPDLSDFQVRK